jgi:hypothetical protein
LLLIIKFIFCVCVTKRFLVNNYCCTKNVSTQKSTTFLNDLTFRNTVDFSVVHKTLSHMVELLVAYTISSCELIYTGCYYSFTP